MASYKSLHFQCPDPILKEAVSRTTRYRLRKKRKTTDDNESVLVEGNAKAPLKYINKIQESVPTTESEVFSEEFHSDALEGCIIDFPEPNSENPGCDSNTDSDLQHIYSDEKESGGFEFSYDEMLQDFEGDYTVEGHEYPLEVSELLGMEDGPHSDEELQQNELAEVINHSYI